MQPTENKSPIAAYIEEYANASSYTYKEIAQTAGFSNADVLYAFMRGEMRVPIDMVDKLAHALGCDAGQLFYLALQQYFSEDAINALQESFFSAPTNNNEAAWIRELRSFYKGSLPPMTKTNARKLKALLKMLH